MAVTVIDVSTVVPSTPTPQPCWSFLSNSDLMLYENMYTKVVYYFKPDAHAATRPFDVLVQELKHSLSITLADYYILAGRVERGKDGRMGVNCNDAGVTFRVAHTAARFDDWDNINACSIEDEINTSECIIDDYSKAPIYQIQVTKFACGGIAIGFALSEMVVDGFSAVIFPKSWGEINRGLKMSTPPRFDERVKLKARNPPVVKVPVRDYVASSLPLDESLNYKMVDPSQYVQEIFFVSADKVDELVREIESGPCRYGPATSFEALSALIWKCMSEARDLADEETTKFVYTVSLRGGKRWDPPLSDGFFGNAVHVPCLPANAGEIKSRHVSYAARLLHDDVRSISTETVMSCNDWMEEKLSQGLNLGYNCDFYCGRDVDCTSMHTFPIYETDFGWGKPVYYSLVIHPWFGDAVAFILPTVEGGRSREIHVQMPKGNMEKLLKSSLAKFATPTKGKKVSRNGTN